MQTETNMQLSAAGLSTYDLLVVTRPFKTMFNLTGVTLNEENEKSNCSYN